MYYNIVAINRDMTKFDFELYLDDDLRHEKLRLIKKLG